MNNEQRNSQPTAEESGHTGSEITDADSPSAAQPENKMGYMPINKLLLTMSIPMIISMLVQACYNVVDSMFVAQVSENALTAVSLAFPIQNLLISLAVGIGVGINALISRALGERRYDFANKIAMQGLFINIIGYVIFLLIGLFATNLYMKSQANIPEIIELGDTYTMIVCALSLGVFVQITFERFLLATGKTFYTMIVQGTGALINIILDPILIFGWLGFPEMGVAGAAIATVCGQTIAAGLAILLNHKFNREIKLHKADFIPDWHYIKPILAIGIPSALMSSIGSVMTFGVNKILMAFTPTAVAVFGIYFKLQSFFCMPVFGLNNGVVPIVAYNYGARKKDRMFKTIRLGIIYAVCIMVTGFAIFQIMPEVLLKMFDASPEMLTIGVPALRITSIIFLPAGFSIMAISVLQALGYSMYSLYISIGRQLVILLPVAYLLAQLGNINLVWWAFPVAEVATVLLAVIFLKKTYSKLAW